MTDDSGSGAASSPGYPPEAVHLLRTSQQVQYQLSQMADQKANMLLGVTFLIFTISLSQVRAGRLELPLAVLAITGFIAAVLAILAVLPAVKPPPAAEAPANILFFGSFAQMAQEDYVRRVLAVAEDSEAICTAFARDIYQNGRVLYRKKYRFLGYAYRALLAGLVCSLIAFLAPYVPDVAPAF